MPAILPLRDAMRVAHEVSQLLRPHCQRMEVVGSVRRQQPWVKDVELLVIPHAVKTVKRTLFGDEEQATSLLDSVIPELVAAESNPLKLATQNPANGHRYKKLMWGQVCQVDLFICLPPASWGALLAIRTGPADFSELLVQSEYRGGAMPQGLRQELGALHNRGGRIETYTEEEYFAALGLPCWPPAERTHFKLLMHLEHRPTTSKEGTSC